ncbi:hypothetical protein [Chlorobium sp.]|jgi:hypothetical protein|uniref:hypothetical protein n=1 Tax=Chlorobium sp. TaxID=1095 RepID=UPI003C4F7B70|nr:hypothetical protein [Chlorobiaceae bacterium]NTW94101.1 hypothetical protein [Chlorobiaceae bacterium]
MSELQEALAWTDIPVPEDLRHLPANQQQSVAAYVRAVVSRKTDGFEDLYHAIGMIVKYIPHFVVIPLMVEHIKPPIAAGVCRKMGVDQATGYANDLPLEYFSEVSRHIEPSMMAELLARMKKHHAEKFIHYELQHHLTHILDIAEHLEKRMLEVVARHVTLPEHDDDLLKHPHHNIIEKIRALQ